METTPNQKDVCSIPFCNVMALASDLCLLSEESEEKEVAFVTVSLRLAAVASSKALYLVFFLVLFFCFQHKVLLIFVHDSSFLLIVLLLHVEYSATIP